MQAGIGSVPHQFGVVMPYATAQGTHSGQHDKGTFLANPLVIARTVGSFDHLEPYFEKAKSSNKVGSYHPFSGRDATVPQGRVLFVSTNINGLDGYFDLSNNGRFVGVAPEAPSAPK